MKHKTVIVYLTDEELKKLENHTFSQPRLEQVKGLSIKLFSKFFSMWFEFIKYTMGYSKTIFLFNLPASFSNWTI